MGSLDLKSESIKYLSLLYITYIEISYKFIDFRKKLHVEMNPNIPSKTAKLLVI